MKTLLISLPKSGTHYVAQLLGRSQLTWNSKFIGSDSKIYTDKIVYDEKGYIIGYDNSKEIRSINDIPLLENEIMCGHLHYSTQVAKDTKQFKRIFLVRNLRDRLVSAARHWYKWKYDILVVDPTPILLYRFLGELYGRVDIAPKNILIPVDNIIPWLNEDVFTLKYETIDEQKKALSNYLNIEDILADDLTNINFGTKMPTESKWEAWWDDKIEKWFQENQQEQNEILGY